MTVFHRCSFDGCGRHGTARGWWTTVRAACWYCRPHLRMLVKTAGVREVMPAHKNPRAV